jgi:hypothetical protein
MQLGTGVTLYGGSAEAARVVCELDVNPASGGVHTKLARISHTTFTLTCSDDVMTADDGSLLVVSTYVTYLRRKLAGGGPDLIWTQRAVGYSLRLPRPVDPADPADPADPVDPADPADPSDPEESQAGTDES